MVTHNDRNHCMKQLQSPLHNNLSTCPKFHQKDPSQQFYSLPCIFITGRDKTTYKNIRVEALDGILFSVNLSQENILVC